jgi:hypothetical protein
MAGPGRGNRRGIRGSSRPRRDSERRSPAAPSRTRSMRRLLQAAVRGDADAHFSCTQRQCRGRWPRGCNQVDCWRRPSRASPALRSSWLTPRRGAKCSRQPCRGLLLVPVSKVNLSGLYHARAQAGYEHVAAGVTPADITAVTSLAERWKPANMPDEFDVPLPKRARRSITT